jgi:hypothetical protein
VSHSSRRISPALIVAVIARFVVLAGTAAAAVIITSPDQLGDGVVTERALASGAVSGAKLADGAVHGVHKVNPHAGIYQVTVSGFDLRGRSLKNCSVTATPTFRITNKQPLLAEVSAGGSLTVTVAVSQILATGGARLADGGFDLTASR